MSNYRRWILVAALIGLTGCIPSLHALYQDEEDCVFEPALLGEWQGDNSGETWKFSWAGEKVYEVIYTDRENKAGAFKGHLVPAGDGFFLDLFPEEPELASNDYYKIHLMRVHTFLKVNLTGDSLQLIAMNPDWLKKLLEEDASVLRHEAVDDSILLTAPPAELQAFLDKYKDDEEAFGDASVMKPVTWAVE